MIEKNSMALKRYRRFTKDKFAVLSVWILTVLLFLSLTAEWWANNKPHLMYFSGKLYCPLLFTYHPTDFGRRDILVMDYRSLHFSSKDWALWPMIQWDAYERNQTLADYPAPPNKFNILGTDDSGRDLLTRLLYGLRFTFLYSFGVWILSYLIGLFVGGMMGYLGGSIDLLGMRLVEVVESFPVLLVLITLNAALKPNIYFLILIAALLSWTRISAQMRGQFLTLKNRDYVEAARGLGASHYRIIFKHILPNALTPILTFAPFAIAANIYQLSIMDFLGLGLPAPTPSWGELFSQAQRWFSTAEWLVWAPSAALLITLTSLITIGQAIRNAFDSHA